MHYARRYASNVIKRVVCWISKRAQGLRVMNGGFWGEIARGFFERPGVATLMVLTGRSIWVLGSVAIATLASARGELTTTRLWVLAALGVVYVSLHLVAFFLGMCWPKRFHFGAKEIMKEEEQRAQSPGFGIENAQDRQTGIMED